MDIYNLALSIAYANKMGSKIDASQIDIDLSDYYTKEEIADIINANTEAMNRINSFENGKSAYEIAVDNGFSGTETEWLNSLEGNSYILTSADKNEIISEVYNSINLSDKENIANKVSSLNGTFDDDTAYPSAKLVKYHVDRIFANLSQKEDAANCAFNIDDSADNIHYPSTKAVKDYVENNLSAIESTLADLDEAKLEIESGSVVADSKAWYKNDSNYLLTGSYDLVGNTCSLYGFAKVVNGWGEVYYSLPVLATQGSGTVTSQNNIKYSITTGLIDNLSVLEIKRLDGNIFENDDVIQFTLTYKYK